MKTITLTVAGGSERTIHIVLKARPLLFEFYNALAAALGIRHWMNGPAQFREGIIIRQLHRSNVPLTVSINALSGFNAHTQHALERMREATEHIDGLRWIESENEGNKSSGGSRGKTNHAFGKSGRTRPSDT